MFNVTWDVHCFLDVYIMSTLKDIMSVLGMLSIYDRYHGSHGEIMSISGDAQHHRGKL